MAFYSGNIRTSILDPRLDKSNKIASFSLDSVDSVYLSNMRLMNIGVTATAGVYNAAAGAYETIERLTLFDGNTQLSQQIQFPRWAAFKNYHKSNEANRSINHFLNGCGMGYEINELDISGGKSANIEPLNGAKGYTTDAATTFQSWLDLKTYLPLLQAVPFLPTKVFKNLRLEIEYNAAVGSAQNTTAPILVVDEIMDNETRNSLEKQLTQVDFVQIEHDMVVVDAITDLSANKLTSVQSIQKQVKGFDNKVLNRLLVVKQPQGATERVSTLMKQLTSYLQHKEKDNLRVNGRTLLVGDGLDTTAKSSAMLSDVWGTCNMFLNRLKLDRNEDDTSVLGSKTQDYLGSQDYRCFRVGQRIEQMEYVFERTGCYDAAEASQTALTINSQLVLHYFGEIPKRLQVNSDGTYLIAYL
jgi:hypothetical protein